MPHVEEYTRRRLHAGVGDENLQKDLTNIVYSFNSSHGFEPMKISLEKHFLTTKGLWVSVP